ncbi:hypothetical protein VNO77_20651 [Canavalia gladiata]|uniref:Wall-associated receptor kinase galacturonan-binding domain-containing protein n=1 Tax=Canavalia gladiata TaxID=3824 RepID=A0AAN9LPY2_CANGL
MSLITKQFLLELFLVTLIVAKAASKLPKQECPTKCGSLSIPYPFGTSEGCYLDESFFINCTYNSSTTLTSPTPFLRHGDLTVLNISLNGELVISFPVVHECYSSNGSSLSAHREKHRHLNLTYFYISTKNKFIALGCDTFAEFWGHVPHKVNYTSTTACASICSSVDDIKGNGSCSGNGCCESIIPNGLSSFTIETWSRDNHTKVHAFNPCSYALVVEESSYKFSTADLKNFTKQRVPILIDWSVGNKTCVEAKRNATAYACKANNSECYNSTNGLGYLCKCHSGFLGNPYLHHGCKDVNQCNVESNPCSIICGNFKENAILIIIAFAWHSCLHNPNSHLVFAAISNSANAPTTTKSKKKD